MLNTANWTSRLGELAGRARVTGATLGIWSDGQQVLAAHGVLNRATRVPVTTDSLFQVGSITKIWTTTMIMQLVDEGLLSLDSTVADVLPGTRLGSADVAGQVTVRHLLTHTSGIDGDIFTDTGRGDDCVQRYVDGLEQATVVFPPGAAYSYSNSGFVVLGRIIEVLDGQSWDESLRARLTGPLHLTQTVTLPEEAILHRAAIGHRGRDPVSVWNLPRSVGPAGLISSTVSDLLTFARLHIDGGVAPDGKRLLGEASVAAMRHPVTAIGDFATPGACVGLGWRLSRWGDRVLIGHDGDTIGQSAHLQICPEARLAVCLLTNSGGTEALYRELFAEVFGTLAGATMPAAPGPAYPSSVSEAAMARHAGWYERSSRQVEISVRDGQLHGRVAMTGHLADLTGAEPEDMVLHPADDSGLRFVCRSRDDQPWSTASFGQLPDGRSYVFGGGRLTPRIW